MKAKHLLPLLTVFTLVGCNKNMTVINDDKAKEIIEGILKRQDDSKLFEKPTTITYKQSEKTIQKSKTVSGESSSTYEKSTEHSIDVNAMKSMSKYNLKYEGYQSKVETIQFFDNSTSNFYILINANGYKTKEIITNIKTEQKAKDYFAEIIDDEEDIGYKNRDYINSFTSKLDEYKQQHERFINEKDQHYNYTFGSNDAKSFQETLDIKIKAKEVKEYTVNYNGYDTTTSNMIMKNDRLESRTKTKKSDIKADKVSFYKYSETTLKDEYSYGSVTINIPSLDEYETI